MIDLCNHTCTVIVHVCSRGGHSNVPIEKHPCPPVLAFPPFFVHRQDETFWTRNALLVMNGETRDRKSKERKLPSQKTSSKAAGLISDCTYLSRSYCARRAVVSLSHSCNGKVSKTYQEFPTVLEPFCSARRRY